MLTGTVQWTAQERVIHGKPAAEAVRAEIERIGAKRVLLLTTRSLTDEPAGAGRDLGAGRSLRGPVLRDPRPLAA